MKLDISKTPSAGIKKLFWHIFFETRNRGVSLERHFPWMEKSSEQSIFFEVTISSTTVAGLVLRQKKYQTYGQTMKIGLIGLVCVSPSNRGAGIAATLLKKAIEYSENENYNYLTLWTSQHDIYFRHKFYIEDPWLYGWVHTENCIYTSPCTISTNNMLASELTSSSLPPFASAVYQYSMDCFSFTTIRDSDGDIVVDYDGDALTVGLFMIKELPIQWRLNIRKNDPLISVMASLGSSMKLSEVNLQMWLGIKQNNLQDDVIGKIKIPFLDRI